MKTLNPHPRWRFYFRVVGMVLTVRPDQWTRHFRKLKEDYKNTYWEKDFWR